MVAATHHGKQPLNSYLDMSMDTVPHLLPTSPDTSSTASLSSISSASSVSSFGGDGECDGDDDNYSDSEVEQAGEGVGGEKAVWGIGDGEVAVIEADEDFTEVMGFLDEIF